MTAKPIEPDRAVPRPAHRAALASGGGALGRIGPVRLQGAYYIVTGLWPILHLRSFMALTGPKHDTWLVRTFGALVSAIGISLLSQRPDPVGRRATATLAVSSAAALAACEVVFVARGRISPVYLADAFVELGLAAAIVSERLEAGPG